MLESFINLQSPRAVLSVARVANIFDLLDMGDRSTFFSSRKDSLMAFLAVGFAFVYVVHQ